MSTIGFYTDAGEQTNVSASVAQAEASATAAGVSETNAALSETNAASSAASAQASEANVIVSAAAAALSETNAGVSETNAAASAGNASNSEIAAGVSETNAASSAASALVSENNAAATLADALVKTNNLSDVSSVVDSRGNLDVYSKAETDSGRKNYLINGDMSIWQRGESFVDPLTTTYTADRWLFRNSPSVGGTTTITRSETTITSFLKATHVGATSSTYIRQKIEGKSLAGTEVTISGQVNSNIATELEVLVQVFEGGVGGSVVTSSIVSASNVNAWNDFSTTVTIPTGTTSVKTAEDYIQMSILYAAAGGGAVGTAVVNFRKLQLETGSNATDFEYVSAGDNLAACQRYYQSVASEINCFPIFNSVSDLSRRGNVLNPVTMRGIPAYVITGSGGTWATGPAIRQVSADGFAIFGTASTNVSFTTVTTWTADAEL